MCYSSLDVSAPGGCITTSASSALPAGDGNDDDDDEGLVNDIHRMGGHLTEVKSHLLFVVREWSSSERGQVVCGVVVVSHED